MGFAHPLLFLLLPVAAAVVVRTEARLEGTRRRRVARGVVRFAVLALLLGALAGPYTETSRARGERLVVAVDRASWMSRDARRDARLEVERATAEATGRGARVTLLGFADVAARPFHVASPASGWPASDTGDWPEPDPASSPTAVPEPPPSGTGRPAVGLGAAQLAFAPGETGGVLLLTTGRGDLTALEQAAHALRQSGLALRAAALPRTVPAKQVAPRVDAVDAPGVARGPFDVRARIDAAGDVSVALHVDGREVELRPVPGRGARDVTFTDLALAPGLHEVALLVDAGSTAGEAARSTLARRLVRVEAPPRVLVAVSSPATSLALRAVRGQGFEVTELPPASLAAALAGDAGGAPESVLLDAASAAALPPAVQRLLVESVERGLGLFLEAGDDAEAWTALAVGAAEGTPLGAVLPVLPRVPPPPPPPEAPPPEAAEPSLDPPEPTPTPGLRAEREPAEALPISLMLVLDRSGSMAGSKLAMAIEGARRAAATLSRFDRVGVVTFADESTLDIPPTSLRRLGNLGWRLATIQADGNTDIYGALARAARVMEGEDAPIRHLILLTDGRQNATEALFSPLMRRMAEAGITLTAVGLGFRHDELLLKGLIQFAPRGRYIPADTEAELPTILTRDTQIVAERREREAKALARIPDPDQPPSREPPPEPEPPPPPPPEAPLADPATELEPSDALAPLHLLRPHEATRGVDESALPAIGAPRPASPVPMGALLLTRGDGEPVLAARRSGLGRVLAFVVPPDAAGLSAFPDLDRILVQGMRSVRAPEGALDRRPWARLLHTPDGERLRLDDAPEGEAAVPVRVHVSAGGDEQDLGTFLPGQDVALPQAPAGTVATLRLLPEDGSSGGPPITYLVRERGSDEPQAGDAEALARAVGAESARPDAPLWPPERRDPSPRPLWPWLVVAALLLLPFDVALHRRADSGTP